MAQGYFFRAVESLCRKAYRAWGYKKFRKSFVSGKTSYLLLSRRMKLTPVFDKNLKRVNELSSGSHIGHDDFFRVFFQEKS